MTSSAAPRSEVRVPELVRATTPPARWYRDPAVWEAERRAVFRGAWLLVGHESMWPRPGDVRAESLAGFPVFVVRGRDGALRGFHNVCRHRGGPLVFEDEDRCPVLRCRYHGWVYDAEGRLERAPDFGDAEDFDRRDWPLFRLGLEVWRGFVFASLDPGAGPLAPAVAALDRLAAPLSLESYAFHARVQHDLACNWKVYVENYLEGYHVPYLHPSLHREVDSQRYRVEVHGEGRCVSHHVPTRPGARQPVYDGLWAWLWPSVALNVYGSGLSVERMLPLGPRSTRLEYLFLFRDEAGEQERERALEMCARVTEEDRRICEAVQRNLDAGVYRSGRLSPRHENGVFAFQRRLAAALDGEAAAADGG